MLENEVAFTGPERRVVWAREASGRLRAREFFESVAIRDRARVWALFERMGDFGVIRNTEKFRNEGEGIYCFKVSALRFPCFIDGRDVVVTHGFVKRRAKMPRVEFDRAQRIRAEYMVRRGSR